ncbi:MAG: hypothetical protein ACK41Q_00250 [Candidatus Brocadia sp.]
MRFRATSLVTLQIKSCRRSNLLFDEQIIREDTNTITALKDIVRAIEEIQDHIKNKKSQLKEAITPEERLEIIKEIDILKKRLESLEGNFEAIATGLDMEAFTAKPQKRFDWKEEVQSLIGPLVNIYFRSYLDGETNPSSFL